MRVARALAAGLVLALFVVGLALYPMLHPTFTKLLSQRYSLVADTGLSNKRVLQVAERVRDFVADDDREPLPTTVDGRPGFDAAATSHLRDVHQVLGGARVATGLLAALVVVGMGVLIARRRFAAISDAMLAGGAVCMLLVALAALAGTMNFESFFGWFHGLFFSAGTWEFPADSLLIEVFPDGFWMAAGLTWGALVLLGGAVLGVAGWLVRGTELHASGGAVAGRRMNDA